MSDKGLLDRDSNSIKAKTVSHTFNIVVIVAALGYFVDIYDLILFSIVRQDSLSSLGLSGKELLDTGFKLLNMQMWGMLVGGILWGILGDKKGRISVLFGTILLYSLANIANGMAQTLNQYFTCRFFAGLGLAGELGIGITLVSEVMSKETRGYGTTIVSSIGIAGAVAGYFVTKMFDWRMAYYVGGGLGLLLLLLRVSVYESGMFAKMKTEKVRKGNFISLFTDRKRLFKYLRCILIGVPVWYVIGILITAAPEFAKDVLHVDGIIDGKKAVMVHYIGASIGALLSGLGSQWLGSRKKALMISLISLALSLAWLFCASGVSANMFYFILFVVGVPNGFWSVFVTVASEQFGTNLRATVTTTVPNFVRGTTILMTTGFGYLAALPAFGKLYAAIAIGVVVMALAIYATLTIEETHHKELDYLEEF